ncbi:AAA family ATPase [Alkalicoccobacillus porphyridii]|uniref:Nuclease SbcCD subunit C n=1 Tax=Alkalicoccobacillus porphyridii TaxID=2597270 RepID=A0A554A1X9_9BACI|nr:AAA family ATPase [Alkalicoccobacillus porphyridii]TSB47698.1 AAA family ATPase [Alkalicoccobacillus porphyridii]
MILHNLTMHHFRQFYGEQSISFAADEEIVTVIRGENGRGKTGIYRAVLFALYGDERLDQDGNDSNIVIPNIKALDEAKTVKQPVKVIVTIEFSQGHTVYKLTRSLLASVGETDTLYISDRSVTLTFDDKQITSKDEVDQVVTTILDNRMKHYFFFDGERMERLTRASSIQRKDVAAGIKNLLNIDQLRDAEKAIAIVASDVKKQLERHSTGRFQQNLQRQLVLEEEIEKAKTESEQLTETIEKMDEQFDSLTDQLNQYEEQRKAEEVFTQQLAILDQSKQQEQQVIEELIKMNQHLPLILAKDQLYRVQTSINTLLSGTTEQSGVGVDWLNHLLEDLTCICDRAFDKGSESYQAIESLIEAAKKSEEKKQYYPLLATTTRLIGQLEGKAEELEQLLERQKQVTKKRLNQETTVQDVANKRYEQAAGTIAEIISKRDKVMEDRSSHMAFLRKQEVHLKEAEDELQTLKTEANILKAKSDIHKQLLRKQEEVEKAAITLKGMIQTFEQSMMRELEDVAMQNLQYLLDEGSLTNIRKVKIKPDYSLEVENGFGQEFLANISQGQRQILSLSFITALAQLAGGESTLELPLFMDTPFGRLSSEHHNNLISYIPNVCSQWILLVTDREFTDEQKDMLEDMGHLGHMYQLVTKEKGVTEITTVRKGIHV